MGKMKQCLLKVFSTARLYVPSLISQIESGNMIIMALSYAQKTGDLSMVTEYSSLFQQWAQYLVENSMVPDHQLSTDDFAGPLSNQTNLAIKGIVAIRAMSEISKLLGQQEASDRYKVCQNIRSVDRQYRLIGAYTEYCRVICVAAS